MSHEPIKASDSLVGHQVEWNETDDGGHVTHKSGIVKEVIHNNAGDDAVLVSNASGGYEGISARNLPPKFQATSPAPKCFDIRIRDIPASVSQSNGSLMTASKPSPLEARQMAQNTWMHLDNLGYFGAAYAIIHKYFPCSLADQNFARTSLHPADDQALNTLLAGCDVLGIINETLDSAPGFTCPKMDVE